MSFVSHLAPAPRIDGLPSSGSSECVLAQLLKHHYTQTCHTELEFLQFRRYSLIFSQLQKFCYLGDLSDNAGEG